MNYLTKSAFNVTVWLNRLDELLNDHINACDARVFHVRDRIA